MRKFLICLSIATLTTLPLMSPAAQAQQQDPILALPDGQVILSISATEQQEVEQDLLVANLSYNAINRDPTVLQNEINSVMAKALESAKKVDTVKVNTGSYQVYQFTEKRTDETKWRGNQSLTLKSKNAEDLLELVGDLQDMKLTMNGLNYTLAPETAVSIQDSLMESALKELKTRADRAATALGKSGAELREVNVQSSGMPYPQPYRGQVMMMESARADMAPPVAAAGETTITLTVSARALLKP